MICSLLLTPPLVFCLLTSMIIIIISKLDLILPLCPDRYMLRNSMGACAVMQLPRSPAATRTLTPGGLRAGGGIFYPIAFGNPAPRLVYPTSPIRPAAIPYYPTPSPPHAQQTYYDQQSMGIAKRSSSEQVCGLVGVDVATHFRDHLHIA